MLELVMRREHDYGSEAHRQREEALRHRVVPDQGIPESVPVGSDEVEDAVDGAWEGHRAYQQPDHHDVREDRQEVGRLARGLDPANDYQEDGNPAHREAQGQTPVRGADAVGDVGLLAEDLLAVDIIII